ncbi:macrophage-expressed gene 1 protein-like [Corythoichthys intestinalis]|uniref:macrophage-expressed gene 1 protein-like n=1 Tax=Corythoichthys intestinalis TaxID=161448 RepID=UPI0025A5F7F3|nr:macrophage-expressed gene 1 protein-like [Corythoichthys intestinalis]XP_061804699.1 macrophage-expressed gene 1 protein-like [Nerophis lumbriciformis]
MRAPVTLLALSLLHSCLSVPVSRPTNWLRQCRASTNLSITALGALPGGGWDNLRNMDMGRVMNLSYFHCQTTEDGLYYIPDEVFVIPHKETGVETNSEMIRSWQEHKSSMSRGINADVSFFSLLNGKFSLENLRMKIHQVEDSSTTTRVQVRNLIYTVKAYPDFNLDSRFAEIAKEIADAIENNQTKNGNYLSEKMVLEYGTHVITSVDVGAVLVEEDYLRNSYVSDNESQSSSIKVSAGLNFFDKLKFDISSQNTKQSSSLQAYQSNIQYSLIQSHGSIPFYPGITLQKWQESTRNNLVAVDRLGLALPFFINANTLPDLPQPTVNKVANSVRKAIERYYKVNTRPGCVDINSKNFNFQANIDDASCEGPTTNLSFGGVYQECIPISQNAQPLCDALAQKNPDTGAFSCSSPYTATLLRSEVRQQAYTKYECHDETYRCGIFYLRTCHRQVCQDNAYVRSAHIKTYWCSFSGEAPENTGYLFGGIYGPSLVNPITNSKTCPTDFLPLKFLSDGQMICLSKDYETGTKYAVPFGGLFSCQSNNVLAGNQHRCPPKFSQHLAAVSDGCEILYCVQSGLFTGGQLLPIHLPPFTRAPCLTAKTTNTVMVLTEGEKSWVRVGNTKAWKLADAKDVREILQNFSSSQNQMSSGEKAGLAFGVMGMMALVAVGVVLVKRRKMLHRITVRRGYTEILQEESVDNERERAILEENA